MAYHLLAVSFRITNKEITYQEDFSLLDFGLVKKINFYFAKELLMFNFTSYTLNEQNNTLTILFHNENTMVVTNIFLKLLH